jgi:hypothetical protein
MKRKIKPRNPIAKKMLEDKAYREKTTISKKFKEPERLTVQEATRIIEEEDE